MLRTLAATLSIIICSLLVTIEAPAIHREYLYRAVSLKIVRLVIPSEHRAGGTGFQVIAPSGRQYTLSNRHVCLSAENGIMAAQVPGTERFINLQVLELAKHTDLCILEPIPYVKGVKIAGSVQVGEEVGVIGHPLLQAATLARGTLTNYENISLVAGFDITDGLCASQNGKQVAIGGIESFLFGYKSACVVEIYSGRVTSVVYPGNSGSPVVNIWGNLVGVLFASDNRTNYGFIVPHKDVQKFLEIY